MQKQSSPIRFFTANAWVSIAWIAPLVSSAKSLLIPRRKLLLSLILGIAFASSHYSIAQAQTPKQASDIQGKLMIVGGGLRYDNRDVWQRLVMEAGGPGSNIAVIPSASASPERVGNTVVDVLKSYGANAYLIPLSEKLLDEQQGNTSQIVNRAPQWIDRLAHSNAVYFTGGDQNRIIRALYQRDGQASPLLDAIWDLYRRGGVIAGTSAGAAIMSEIMFTNTGSVLSTLQGGVQRGQDYDRGLGFIGPNILVDQHLIIRGRFARMLPVMQKESIPLGLGIDENTAMLIDRQRTMEVIGYKGAIVLELDPAHASQQSMRTVPKRPQRDHATGAFSTQGARIHYLSHGDKLDLQSRAITPAADKELIVNAQNEESDQQASIYTNVLANTAVVELMSQLIESPSASIKGLAFEPGTSPHSRIGFEMLFTKTSQSKGYYSSKTGMEAYTVKGIQLDVRPVMMAQPLFRSATVKFKQP